MAKGPIESQHRVYGLDLMRAWAILLVLALHTSTLPQLRPVLGWLENRIPDGVTLFFVLSGYLIGAILLNLLAQPRFGLAQAGRFWMRRWLRTLPAYYVVLALLFCTVLLGWTAIPELRLRHYLLFLQNFARPHPWFFPEAWSLAVEEWFYLLLPLLLVASLALRLRARRETMLLGWVLLCIVAIPLYRAGLAQAHGYAEPGQWDLWLRKQVLSRLDAIAWGVLAAWLHRARPALWMARPRSCLTVGLVLFCLMRGVGMGADLRPFMDYLYLSLDPLACALMLPALSQWRGRGGTTGRVFSFIAAVSYPLYLVHLSLAQTLLSQLLARLGVAPPPGPGGTIVLCLAYWTGAFLLAWLIHVAVEQPVLRWRDHRVRREAAALPALAGG
jgi:peptidoglycan/LPS O-acetylase OafA/YrhL